MLQLCYIYFILIKTLNQIENSDKTSVEKDKMSSGLGYLVEGNLVLTLTILQTLPKFWFYARHYRNHLKGFNIKLSV